jgi:translation initiation factor IF-2
MNLKEFAEKIKKTLPEAKKLLADKGLVVKTQTASLDEKIVQRIITELSPKKPARVVKVIKKADIDSIKDQSGEMTIGQKAFKVMEQAKKPADEKKEEKETSPNLEKKAEKVAEAAVPPAKPTEVAKATAGLDTVVDVADLLAKRKDAQRIKSKAFDEEGRFVPRGFQEQSLFKPKQKKRKSKYKKLKLEKEKEIEQQQQEEQGPLTEITLKDEMVSIGDLAAKMRLKITDIIGALLKENILVTINQQLDINLATRIGQLFNIVVKTDFSEKEDSKIKYDVHFLESSEGEDTAENLVTRPPIVTIMGHVDHGKTKLLDAIRSSRIAEGEAGGITQHIGAYQVEVKGKKVTFLDTPGHEAFTALRARGSQITDIVILVVAADDGVMPQTIEALDHAKAAGVPIIVAVNKIDLPGANPDRVKTQLTEHGLVAEEWGGKTIFSNISAKQKIGLDELLDTVLLVAEVEDLKANPHKKAQGIVVESKLSQQRGPVATILIKGGTLRKGDPFVIGPTYGCVRAMFNDLGKEVEEAPPSYPVEILGITEVPRAGDIFQVVASEKEARDMALTTALQSQSLQKGELKTMNIILKADVQGSLEALLSSIQKLSTEQISVNIVHSGTGIINKSDIILASASGAVIATFNTGVQNEARALASDEGVEIREYNIIYKMLEDLELAMKGMLEPEFEMIEIGRAEVRSVFSSSKVGTIAGGFVLQGVIRRHSLGKVYRGNKLIHEGKLNSLKRFKDDVKEVQNNFECGFTIEKFDDLKEGDQVVFFEEREKVRS